MAEEATGRRPVRAALGLLGALAALAAAVSIGLWDGAVSERTRWLVILVALALALVLLGYATTGAWVGLVMNSRFLVSMSRVQATMWSVVVLGTLLAFTLRRLRDGDGDAWRVGIPPEVLGVVGVAGTSYVAANGVLSRKTHLELDRAHVAKQAEVLVHTFPAYAQDAAGATVLSPSEAVKVASADHVGALFQNGSPADARLWDMLEGDEYGNAHAIDFAKVQVLVLTIIAIIAFCAAVWAALGATGTGAPGTGATGELPGVGSGLLEVLAVSHLGYVGGKLPSHSVLAKA
jgi:hypothetical protein